MAEICTRRDAEKLAALFNRLAGGEPSSLPAEEPASRKGTAAPGASTSGGPSENHGRAPVQPRPSVR